MGQKYLVLTCNVEALASQAAGQHVDKLIWGRFPNAPREAGISAIMDIADEFGVKITFFHDVLESLEYGRGVTEAGRLIAQRGHDLQLYTYIDFLPDAFWTRLGYKPPTWAMNLFSEEAARIVLQHATELFTEMAGHAPIAYRAGSFRYNQFVLQALAAMGFRMSFQYYPTTRYKPSYPHGFDAGVLPVFNWSNGLIEVPVGCLEYAEPRPEKQARFEGFEFQLFAALKQAQKYMQSFWSLGPEHNVLVLVLHSWSLLARDAAGHYVWKDNSRIELLRQLLLWLEPDVQVVSASQLLELIDSGCISPSLKMPIDVAGNDAIPLYRLQEERK